MISRLVLWSAPALVPLLLATGCSRPQLASRPMTPTECEWASVIQRSYPGWKAPFYLPTRSDWRAQPVHGVTVDGLAAAPEAYRDSAPMPGPEPMAPAAARRQTVVDVPFGATPAAAAPASRGGLLPPILVGSGQLNSPMTPPCADERVSRPAAAVPAQSSLDDVEFVPADGP